MNKVTESECVLMFAVIVLAVTVALLATGIVVVGDRVLNQCQEAMSEELLRLGNTVIHDSNTIRIDGDTKAVTITNGDELIASGVFLSDAPGCFYVLLDQEMGQ